MDLDASLGDAPERWQFCMMDHRAHCIALMVNSRTAPELHVWEARPLLALSTKLPARKELWFPNLAVSS